MYSTTPAYHQQREKAPVQAILGREDAMTMALDKIDQLFKMNDELYHAANALIAGTEDKQESSFYLWSLFHAPNWMLVAQKSNLPLNQQIEIANEVLRQCKNDRKIYQNLKALIDKVNIQTAIDAIYLKINLFLQNEKRRNQIWANEFKKGIKENKQTGRFYAGIGDFVDEQPFFEDIIRILGPHLSVACRKQLDNCEYLEGVGESMYLFHNIAPYKPLKKEYEKKLSELMKIYRQEIPYPQIINDTYRLVRTILENGLANIKESIEARELLVSGDASTAAIEKKYKKPTSQQQSETRSEGMLESSSSAESLFESDDDLKNYVKVLEDAYLWERRIEFISILTTLMAALSEYNKKYDEKQAKEAEKLAVEQAKVAAAEKAKAEEAAREKAYEERCLAAAEKFRLQDSLSACTRIKAAKNTSNSSSVSNPPKLSADNIRILEIIYGMHVGEKITFQAFEGLIAALNGKIVPRNGSRVAFTLTMNETTLNMLHIPLEADIKPINAKMTMHQLHGDKKPSDYLSPRMISSIAEFLSKIGLSKGVVAQMARPKLTP